MKKSYKSNSQTERRNLVRDMNSESAGTAFQRLITRLLEKLLWHLKLLNVLYVFRRVKIYRPTRIATNLMVPMCQTPSKRRSGGRTDAGNRTWCILALKCDVWLQ